MGSSIREVVTKLGFTIQKEESHRTQNLLEEDLTKQLP